MKLTPLPAQPIPKSIASPGLLVGVELFRMLKKGQLRKTRGDVLSPAEPFYALAA